MPHIIQEFMRGSVIEYQQKNPLQPNYLKYFRDIVWGTTTDDNANDILEIGKFGCKGYIDLSDVCGVEITDSIIKDYGFVLIENLSDAITFYRDDFGYIKLDTYGIEHVYMKGKCIKYLHNFQRVFLDYTGKMLYPKPSSLPKKEFKSLIIKPKEYDADTLLKNIKELQSISSVKSDDVSIELEF